MSDPDRILREVDDLETRLRRLMREAESGQVDADHVAQVIRRLLRDQVADIERLVRDLR